MNLPYLLYLLWDEPGIVKSVIEGLDSLYFIRILSSNFIIYIISVIWRHSVSDEALLIVDAYHSCPLVPMIFYPTPTYFIWTIWANATRTRLVNVKTQSFVDLQQLEQYYWTRWSKEYLTELWTHGKWNTQSEKITAGTLVLPKYDNLQLHPGSIYVYLH